MFTAKDMHNKLKVLQECEGIDWWIESTLYEKFVQFGKVATVYSNLLGERGWNKTGFILELQKRGFSVEYKSDQRDGDYYQITYPLYRSVDNGNSGY